LPPFVDFVVAVLSLPALLVLLPAFPIFWPGLLGGFACFGGGGFF